MIARRSSPRTAAVWGAVFGVAGGWTVAWWLALTVAGYFDASLPIGVAATTLVFLVALGTTFGAFAAAAAWVLAREAGLRGRLAVAALLALAEVARERVFGEPWALFGYTQHAVVPLVQVVALTGVYGLDFLLAFVADALAEGWVRWREGWSLRVALRPLAAPAALVGVVALGGALVVPIRDPALAGSAARVVAVVQSDTAPAFHWTRSYAETQLLANLRLTERDAAAGAPALVVWPEDAITLYLEHEPFVQHELGRVATRLGADLVVGGPRADDGRTFNSARLVRPGGAIAGHVDKRRLVPFAEARPSWLATADAADATPRDFARGGGPGLLPAFVPLGVSICHEAIHPDVTAASVRAGAAVLVNIANDGWLDGGHGVGSRQHAAMAAVRAVETRRWLVRAATTGVSEIVDPWGRTVVTLPAGATGVAHATVAPHRRLTPYVRFGDVFAAFCAALALVVAAPHLGRARRARPALVPARASA